MAGVAKQEILEHLIKDDILSVPCQTGKELIYGYPVVAWSRALWRSEDELVVVQLLILTSVDGGTGLHVEALFLLIFDMLIYMKSGRPQTLV